MATYCVTFRISEKTVGGKTSDQRRQTLIENAHEGCDGFWDETTSFLLVGSHLSTPGFAAKVCGGLSATHDMVVVFDPGDLSACYFGALEHLGVLRSFFPLLKKLP